jgi:hypothetical protein
MDDSVPTIAPRTSLNPSPANGITVDLASKVMELAKKNRATHMAKSRK